MALDLQKYWDIFFFRIVLLITILCLVWKLGRPVSRKIPLRYWGLNEVVYFISVILFSRIFFFAVLTILCHIFRSESWPLLGSLSVLCFAIFGMSFIQTEPDIEINFENLEIVNPPFEPVRRQYRIQTPKPKKDLTPGQELLVKTPYHTRSGRIYSSQN